MWIVITGAPSSGKSSLLESLRGQGFHVVPESAREVLAGTGMDESVQDVQRLIEQRQIGKETGLPPGLDVVLDRALPDSIAYRRLTGMDEADLRPLIQPAHYTTVFICGFGEHIPDGLRKDDAVRALHIESLLRTVYLELGCEVVELPWFTELTAAEGIRRRLALILEHLSRKGLSVLPVLPTIERKCVW